MMSRFCGDDEQNDEFSVKKKLSIMRSDNRISTESNKIMGFYVFRGIRKNGTLEIPIFYH